MTPPLVILSSSDGEAALGLQAAVLEVGAPWVFAPLEDVTWLAAQLNPAAVVLDAPADPAPDHPIHELSRMSRSTGMAVLARRERFAEEPPCSAPRLTFVEAADGLEHLICVLHALLFTAPESAFDIEVDVDLTWVLRAERVA